MTKPIKKKHKIIITGTGRTGTTFLVQLLTYLGLDTGFKDIDEGMYEICDAGMEYTLVDPSSPYIVKNPWLCDELDDIMRTGEVVIDHAFIPIRNLKDAAASRIHVSEKAKKKKLLSKMKGIFKNEGVPGGLWHTKKPSEQTSILAQQLYKLIYTITLFEIPHTFLDFPRIIKDPNYLYAKLSPVLGVIDYKEFKHAFDVVANPSLVHDFN